jgi:hypothetical protein
VGPQEDKNPTLEYYEYGARLNCCVFFMNTCTFKVSHAVGPAVNLTAKVKGKSTVFHVFNKVPRYEDVSWA